MKPTVGLTKIFLGGQRRGKGMISANVYGQRVVFEKHGIFEGMLNLFSLQAKAAVFLQWVTRIWDGTGAR
jgi:hypothetical protein